MKGGHMDGGMVLYILGAALIFVVGYFAGEMVMMQRIREVVRKMTDGLMKTVENSKTHKE